MKNEIIKRENLIATTDDSSIFEYILGNEEDAERFCNKAERISDKILIDILEDESSSTYIAYISIDTHLDNTIEILDKLDEI